MRIDRRLICQILIDTKSINLRQQQHDANVPAKRNMILSCHYARFREMLKSVILVHFVQRRVKRSQVYSVNKR